jgi:diguanylate cyclase (GGDEF)-like protein/PAS domain S-box-containing protein
MTSLMQAQRLPNYRAPEQERSFASKLMEMLAVPMFVLNADCKVILWNRACEQLTGVPAHEMIGTGEHWRSFYALPRPTLADLLILKRTDEIEHLYSRASHNPPGGSALCAEMWCDMPRCGKRRYLAADASPIYDDDGELTAVVQTLRDLTEEKAARSALEQLATRDGLTGLANRRCFDDTLRAEWARAMRQRQPLSLLMVDVDNFKAFNDANGHLGGDDCLKRIAGAVAKEMRANDLVARYGGEEFAVILPNESLKGAAIVAERIRCRVEGLQLPHGSGSTHVTVTDASQLVATADAALYRAKHMGRNRISLPASEALQERY